MDKKKIFQCFITGTGKNLDYFISEGLGGVIFFTHDIPNKMEFLELVKGIKQKFSDQLSPFLSIDQEGGRVERTEKIHPRYLSARQAYQKGCA